MDLWSEKHQPSRKQMQKWEEVVGQKKKKKKLHQTHLPMYLENAFCFTAT